MNIIKKHAVALSAVLALALILGGWEIFKYHLVPKRFGIVEIGKIYRSGRIDPRLMRKTLQRYGIKAVIDLTEPEPGDSAWRAEQEAVSQLGITYFNFPLRGDGTGNITNYARAIAAVELAKKENKPVLVHCAAGAQRTGGVAAAYRILVDKQPPATAYAELTRYGWKSRKDKILLEYLNAHLSELDSILQDMLVISRERRSIPRIAP